LESVYEVALMEEFEMRNIHFQRQVKVPLFYKGINTGKDFFLDILISNEIIIELKAIEGLLPIHEAQLISYLRLADKRMGFLVNFNVTLLKNGFKRFVNNY
jgi:GxxExxY protein